MKSAMRIALAVLAGLFAWFAAATIGNRILRATLAGYVDAERALAFTLPMMSGRLALGVVSSIAAGLACRAVAGPASLAPRWLVGALLLVFVPMHAMLWAAFPAWYHLSFLASLVVVPLVAAGAIRSPAPATPASPR